MNDIAEYQVGQCFSRPLRSAPVHPWWNRLANEYIRLFEEQWREVWDAARFDQDPGSLGQSSVRFGAEDPNKGLEPRQAIRGGPVIRKHNRWGGPALPEQNRGPFDETDLATDYETSLGPLRIEVMGERTTSIRRAAVMTVENLLTDLSGQWFADRVHQLHSWSLMETEIVPESLRHMMDFWAQNNTLPEPEVFVTDEGFLANTWETERGILDIEFLPVTRSVKWIRLDRTAKAAQSINEGTKLTRDVADFVRECV